MWNTKAVADEHEDASRVDSNPELYSVPR